MTTSHDTPVLVRCDRVTVHRGRGGARVTALAEVDLTIRHGEWIALYGPSGSGKTTLLHVLGGLLPASEGEVTFDNAPVRSLDRARTERGSSPIAFVFQGAHLLGTLTAYENVAFAAHTDTTDGAAGAGYGPAELLELVGLAAKLDALPEELSGGEAQRVAIARALAQRPSLLLCDEPTGHLDSDTGERVLDLIAALQQELGFTLVIASHDAAVAARADRAVGLVDGRVATAEAVR